MFKNKCFNKFNKFLTLFFLFLSQIANHIFVLKLKYKTMLVTDVFYTYVKIGMLLIVCIVKFAIQTFCFQKFIIVMAFFYNQINLIYHLFLFRIINRYIF